MFIRLRHLVVGYSIYEQDERKQIVLMYKK